MYYVYVLVSKTRNYIYVGMTDNLERRINYHNAGYNRTTKAYRPFYVLLTEDILLGLEHVFERNT
jgi:putative endonuclease